MSWVTVVWSMVASTCLTLAAIYGLVWYRNRTTWTHLFFALTAASTTALAFCELWLMRAETPASMLAALTWAHVPLFFWLVSTVWFVRTYLGAGRLWLAWTICGLRAFTLVANLLWGQDVNFRRVTDVRQVEFLGEPVAVLGAVPNKATPVAQFGSLLILVFVADASVTAWRRGDRRKAVMIGGTAEFFMIASLASASAMIWGNAQMPIMFSVFYLGLVAVMAYELSRDMLRASQLVHELQASDAELRESEARMALAVDAADFGIWIRDLPHGTIWASEKWRELFGFTPSKRLDFDVVLERLHPDDRDILTAANAVALAAGDGGRYQTEYRVVLPDGTTRWISAAARVECDAAGEPILVRGACREVTARKRTEQETQILRQELAHAGRVSMMGQLASALAHEINQPLAAIMGNAAAAERFLMRPGPDLDEIRVILDDIRKDDQRATVVIDRMRHLLQHHAIEPRRLDVGALVSEVASLVRIDAAARQVTLRVDVPPGLPPILGDRVHLQQVMLNLIINGMDATSGPGVAERRVGVTARRSGQNTVEIGVSDRGPGISDDILPRIFEPFFTTKTLGMGMGLAISRTIIGAHGGLLWAENGPGGGAVFRFTLPIADGVDNE